MTALQESFPRLNKGKDGLKTGLLIRGGAALTIYRGSLIAHRFGSELREVPDPNNPRTDLIYDGIATNEITITTAVDSNGAAVDADGNNFTVNTEAGLCCTFDTGTSGNAITAQHIGLPCFGFDSNTLYLTNNGGTLSFVGLIYLFDEDSTIIVDIEAENPLGSYVFGPGPAGEAATSDDTVAGVITNLPAGTWDSTGSIFTVTATGAMPTQDTNITAIGLGDKFIFPAGTLTTQVVTAAHSGVYENTTVGATGVQAVWTRTTKFAKGAVITPKTKIKVGANATGIGAQWGGTEWTTRPATTGLLVGTGDPQLVPDRVTVAGVTLANSTFTITSVPINANTPVGVSCQVTGGTQATGTIGFGTLVAPTPGGVGASAVVVDALKTAYVINNTADTSVLSVTISQ